MSLSLSLRAVSELWQFSAPDIEAALYAEMLAYVYQTARRHITQDNNLHDHRSDNLKLHYFLLGANSDEEPCFCFH
jgi:hypothetical protein